MYLSKIQAEKLTDQHTTKMVTLPQSTVTKNVIILITESTILCATLSMELKQKIGEEKQISGAGVDMML